MVTIEDFMNLDIRVGRITDVQVHEAATKPMYILKVDLGNEIGERTIVAGIRDHYIMGGLENKRIICIVNLEPRKIAGVESQGMLLAAEDDQGNVVLLTTDSEIKEGSKIR